MIEEPVTFLERRTLAGACTVGLELGDFLTVVDLMDNAVSRTYDAFPDRLYLVGKDGHLKYCGGPGPIDFKPEQLETAIRKELGFPPREKKSK